MKISDEDLGKELTKHELLNKSITSLGNLEKSLLRLKQQIDVPEEEEAKKDCAPKTEVCFEKSLTATLVDAPNQINILSEKMDKHIEEIKSLLF